SILVVSTTPDQLDFTRKWLDRLDQGPADQRTLHIYQAKNRDAADLATLLQGMFVGGAPASQAGDATEPSADAEGQSLTAPGSFLATSTGTAEGLRISADPAANKLLMWSTENEYAIATEALRKLDTPLNQVYVEATIAEVRLDGELSHG